MAPKSGLNGKGHLLILFFLPTLALTFFVWKNLWVGFIELTDLAAAVVYIYRKKST
ncbi:MAG: hypothetical protein ACFB10_07475 [Salibacteraceae bacterium]